MDNLWAMVMRRSDGGRMYLIKAADFQRPSCWMVESGMPAKEAVVAAPIQKLWPLNLVVSWPAQDTTNRTWSTKN